MTNETIRIGIIGAGANTTLMHIPGFQAMNDVEIVSVCNRSRASSKRIAQEHGIQTMYESWSKLIAATDTDAILIGTWPYMHRPMVLSTLMHNKHVLTEARMAMDADEAKEMLQASRAHPNLVTQVVPSPLTLKVDTTIKDLIANGYLGDLLSIDLISHSGGFIDRDGPHHWRHDRDLSGYNILSMGIWYEALMRWVGPASSVSAVTRVNVPARNDTMGNRRVISIPDHVEILCEFVSGPVAHMRFSAITGLAANDRLWLYGTQGTLRLDVSSMTLSGGRRGSGELSKIVIPPNKQGSWRVEEEFVNAIRGNESVTHTSFEDGVKYMEFTEAVTRSARTGARVYLPL